MVSHPLLAFNFQIATFWEDAPLIVQPQSTSFINSYYSIFFFFFNCSYSLKKFFGFSLRGGRYLFLQFVGLVRVTRPVGDEMLFCVSRCFATMEKRTDCRWYLAVFPRHKGRIWKPLPEFLNLRLRPGACEVHHSTT